MSKASYAFISVGVVLAFFVLVSQPAEAATVSDTLNVSVTATVLSPEPPEEPETAVRFQGLAYPGTELTFQENGTFLATVPTDPAARFDVAITIDPGTYTFSIFGDDVDGREGPVFQISLTLTSGVTATITGIFLGPTIEADKDSMEIGETITIFGITVPDSTVNLFVSSEEETTHTVEADSDGLWSKSLVAGEELLNPGNHEARSKATSPGDSVSEFSKTVAFTITEEEEPDPCEFSSLGDLNCDGYVNLVDFSILMFYWQTTNPANPRADINQDGIVDIIDFSIMMFYWTG
ncbi:MAG: dockerin type I repeat-containing protein [bacterium]